MKEAGAGSAVAAHRAAANSSGSGAPFRGLRRPVHLDLVGALVHGLYFGTYRRHLGLAEMPYRGQLEELLGVPAARADLDQPGRRRVILDLMAAGGVVGAGLVNHQDLLVAGARQAGLLAGAGDHGDVVELDRRDQAFPVLHPGPGLTQHVDAAVGAVRASDPGARRPGELAAVVLLGVLAEVPHVALVILGEEGQLLLLQLAFEEVPVPGHHGPDPVDHLGQVGDGESDAVRLGLPALHDPALVGELRADREREHRVVYREWRGELARPR